MASRFWTILLSVLAGVFIGAVLVQSLGAPISGTSVPSHGIATATGCADADDPRAWVGQVPNADYRAVYLMNYTFVHDDPDIELRGELVESSPGDWEFQLETTPGTSEKDVPADCQPRTIVDASVALPTTAESLTVTLDGETITVVETTGSSPRFGYLE